MKILSSPQTRLTIGSIIIIIIIITGVIITKHKNKASEYPEMKRMESQSTTIVKIGNSITVDYIGRLEDGTIFDTSIEKVAKAGGVYQEGRDYSQGLTFQVGAGQMIPGFDKGVVGMKLGETKTINIPYMEAYGEVKKNGEIRMPLTDEFKKYKIGEQIPTQNGIGFITVKNITQKEIIFETNLNHPLAGKNLTFDITIKKIQ